MEARLRALEDALRGNGTETIGDGGDPTSRLHALETKLDAALSSTTTSHTTHNPAEVAPNNNTNNNIKQIWQESDKLMRELDPGSALTHQAQIAAPLLYRRQAVLSCADTLQRDMAAVHEILTLLVIGQQAQILSNKTNDATALPISEMQVLKAPILMQTAAPPADQQERLRQIETTLLGTQQQVESIAVRMDRLVANYHAFVSAVSEKIVLVDEVVASKQGT